MKKIYKVSKNRAQEIELGEGVKILGQEVSQEIDNERISGRK